MQVSVAQPIGATVTGVDLDAVDDAAVEELKTLLAEHGVLVVEEQDLDDGAFVEFLSRFGDLTFAKGEVPLDDHPDLNVISNVGRETPPKSSFHVDTSYLRRPPAYTALRAVTIPSSGGETLFTNQYRSYESLPTTVRDRLEGRTITHIATGVELDEGDERSAEHPAFRRHPISGRTAVYVSTPGRCVAVSGLPDDEGRELVRELIEHSTRPENVFRHTWSPGEVVIFDNRCVMHKADHSDVDGDRVLHRGMVAE